MARHHSGSKQDMKGMSMMSRGVWRHAAWHRRPQIPPPGRFYCGRDVPVPRTVTFIPYRSLTGHHGEMYNRNAV